MGACRMSSFDFHAYKKYPIRPCRIMYSTGAMVELETKVKKGRPSPVCICGTREEVRAARDMLEQNTVTETMTVTPEVMKVMGANNYRVQDRIQEGSGALITGREKRNTVVIVGSKREVGEARRMVLVLESSS